MNVAARTRRSGRRREGAFILAYLLFALALVGVVTVGLQQLRSRDTQAELLASNVEKLVTTISTIRGQLVLCAATYPVGASVAVEVDGELTGGVVATEFPVLSLNGDGTGSLVARVNGKATDMQCPGRPDAPRALWVGRDGVFFPPPVPGFADWTYSVQVGGAPLRVEKIWIELVSTSGETGKATLRRVQQRMFERSGSLGNTVSLLAEDTTLRVTLLDSTTP